MTRPLFRVSADITGFSSGVNPDEFKGTFESGYDPVWEDMNLKHHTQALHCMVGGGDQIYCDAITREPELQSESQVTVSQKDRADALGWINAPDRESKLGHPLTDEMVSSQSLRAIVSKLNKTEKLHRPILVSAHLP